MRSRAALKAACLMVTLLMTTSAAVSAPVQLEAKLFERSQTLTHPHTGQPLTVRVRIRYPQISQHPDVAVQKRLNALLREWAGVTADHRRQAWDHAADYTVVAWRGRTLVLEMEDGGVAVGAASGATVSKTLVLNLGTGRVYKLADLFLPGQVAALQTLVRQRAFCDEERTVRADDPGPLRADQAFLIDGQRLTLLFQRRDICPGVYGPTRVVIEGAEIKGMLDPKGPWAELS